MSMLREAAFDLAACDRIPVESPGTVQPGSAVILFRTCDQRLVAASDNLLALFGMPAGSLLGCGAEALFAPRDAALLTCAMRGGTVPPGRPVTLASGRTIWAGHFDAGPLMGIEIEDAPAAPAIHEAGLAFATESAALGGLARELAGGAVEGIEARGADIAACFRRLTGYHRTLVYAFDADWNGRVLADSLAGAEDSFLGLSFPASDIPGSARRLFLKHPLRMICDTRAADIPILSGAGTSGEIDLSDCTARGVAPVHKRYLRNMGARASMSLALTVNGRLWGIVALHHGTPRRCDPPRRAMARALADVLAGRIAEAESRARAAARRTAVAHAEILVDAARTSPRGLRFARFLAGRSAGILDALGCDGLVMFARRNAIRLGQCPEPATVRAIETRVAAWLDGFGRDGFATNRAAAHWPDLAGDLLPAAAGVVAIGRAAAGPRLIAFRTARRTLRDWAGDPDLRHDRDLSPDLAHPRRSFRRWRRKVADHGLPWPAEIIESGQALLVALGEAEAFLSDGDTGRPAAPPSRDPLTGLADRAALAAALQDGADHPRAVLRIDVPAADPALELAFAEALRRIARSGDLPVRLETGRFVLGCAHGTDTTALDYLAARMQEAAGGCPETAAVPVGIACSESATDPEALVLEAEIALHCSRTAASGRPAHFSAAMATRFAMSRKWDAAIIRSLETGEVRVLYQPVVDAQTLAVREISAGLRIRVPGRTVLTADGALPPCADPALCRRLDDLLFSDAALRRARWAEGPSGTPRIGVALPAARLFDPDFARGLSTRPFRQGLVVTLRDIGADMPDELLRWAVENLHEAGAMVELAGFGAACAPLSALVRIRPDRLRLDPGLVAPLTRSETALTLIETLVALGEALGIPVAADGVETLAQAAILRDMGCTLLRGPAFAPPVEPIRIAQMILFPPWAD